ncbi:hypothetical protein X946_652 [Burkholderia sp. ABCPW 111]|nr:hypothetical protein X946_652 [Burkholderia sp. ABCPW 111]
MGSAAKGGVCTRVACRVSCVARRAAKTRSGECGCEHARSGHFAFRSYFNDARPTTPRHEWPKQQRPIDIRWPRPASDPRAVRSGGRGNGFRCERSEKTTRRPARQRVDQQHNMGRLLQFLEIGEGRTSNSLSVVKVRRFIAKRLSILVRSREICIGLRQSRIAADAGRPWRAARRAQRTKRAGASITASTTAASRDVAARQFPGQRRAFADTGRPQ